MKKLFLPIAVVAMGIFAGFLRGVGKSFLPMVSSVIAVFSVRITWIYVFFPMYPDSIQWLYLCLPITWALTIIVNSILVAIEGKRLKKLADPKDEPAKVAA